MKFEDRTDLDSDSKFRDILSKKVMITGGIVGAGVTVIAVAAGTAATMALAEDSSANAKRLVIFHKAAGLREEFQSL